MTAEVPGTSEPSSGDDQPDLSVDPAERLTELARSGITKATRMTLYRVSYEDLPDGHALVTSRTQRFDEEGTMYADEQNFEGIVRRPPPHQV